MDKAVDIIKSEKILHTTRNGNKAYGVYDGEKFDVLEGSQIVRTSVKSVSPSIEKQRQTAFSKGDITEKDGLMILNVSMSFTSPSTAASFVLGCSANGWSEWKDKDGKTLDQLYRQ